MPGPGSSRCCATGCAAPTSTSPKWRCCNCRSGWPRRCCGWLRDQCHKGFRHRSDVPARARQHRRGGARERQQVPARMAALRPRAHRRHLDHHIGSGKPGGCGRARLMGARRGRPSPLPSRFTALKTKQFRALVAGRGGDSVSFFGAAPFFHSPGFRPAGCDLGHRSLRPGSCILCGGERRTVPAPK